jgi:hypothetical protein
VRLLPPLSALNPTGRTVHSQRLLRRVDDDDEYGEMMMMMKMMECPATAESAKKTKRITWERGCSCSTGTHTHTHDHGVMVS